MSNKILVVEDDEFQQELLWGLLHDQSGYDVVQVYNGRDAIRTLDNSPNVYEFGMVIMDVNMPIMNGIEALGIIAQKYPDIPVIMLTGTNDVSMAVQAMKLGAIDFIRKPVDKERLQVRVQNAQRIHALSREVSRLKSDKEGRFTFEHLIGFDNGLQSSVQIGRKASSSQIPVLITGETGTGKEVFAKAIHGESNRAGKPFIAVNCGAIPSQLVESTLFGHEKGSFTGATEKVIGKFREANGGTIFLDEVGELPLDTQVKLLRVLQQKEVEPVGAGKPVKVDVRIVSATNRDLEHEVSTGHFREDLFFRLNVLHIELPRLDERRQDIAMLARYFVERFAAENKVAVKEISKAAYTLLERAHWSGNVRQLENTIKRAMVIGDGSVLEVDDFSVSSSGDAASSIIRKSGEQSNAITASMAAPLDIYDVHGKVKTMDMLEQEIMRAVLDDCGGNVTQASKRLGMAKSTFYRKTVRDSNPCCRRERVATIRYREE